MSSAILFFSALVLFLFGCLFLTVFILMRSRGRVRHLEERQHRLEVEEQRMFSFLHHLGEALHKDNSPLNMRKTITEGVIEVVEAQGGALYLFDKKRGKLAPVYISESSVPLIRVPDQILEKLPYEGDKYLMSYLRLSAVIPDHGLLGECFNSEEMAKIDDIGAHPYFRIGLLNKLVKGSSALIAPLIYAGNQIGILAVTKGEGKAFSKNDGDVFQSLAEQSAFTLGTAIMHREVAEKKRMEDDLQVASDVQRVLLPSQAPEFEGYHIVGTNIPAHILSGDYYDYIPVEEGYYGVVIADVSGKGIPASLVMATCRSVLRAHAPKEKSPTSTLSHVNQMMFSDIREDMFISLAYVILQHNSGEVTLSRAGHDAPFVYRHAENKIHKINSPGLAIGIDGGEVFERVTKDHHFTLEKGDILLLYTDGIVEALDVDENEFGAERLETVFRKAAPRGAEVVLKAVMRAVEDFTGTEVIQNDDITLIAIEKS